MAKASSGKSTNKKTGKTASTSRTVPLKGQEKPMSQKAKQPANMEMIPHLTQEQISERARQIWFEHGCPSGQDETNWFEAEAQLKKEMTK